MEELGELCGLMPDLKHTSECLHRVVSLIGGIGDDFYAGMYPMTQLGSATNWWPLTDTDRDPPSPQAKLKDSLSKPDAFLKNYLELSELTMGTYKHIGRLRYARLIGLELALLYMKMNKHQQALPFLIDLEKTYLTEKWTVLLTDVRRLIYECYDILDDHKKKLKYSSLLAASNDLPDKERTLFLAASRELKKAISAKKEQVIYRMEELFPVVSVRVIDSGVIVTNSPLELQLTLRSNLTEAITVRELAVTMKVEHIKAIPRPKSSGECSIDLSPSTL